MKLNHVLASLITAVGLAVSSAHANQIVNGGFEAGNLAGWTQGGNTGFLGVAAGSGRNGSFGLFAGPIGTVGTLSQTFNTVAGTAYVLTFWLLPDGQVPSSFAADIDGITLLSLTNPSSAPYTQYQASFVGTGSDTLRFSFRDDPGFLFLDDVAVVSAIPEPGALALIGVGLVGFALVRRRKR